MTSPGTLRVMCARSLIVLLAVGLAASVTA